MKKIVVFILFAVVNFQQRGFAQITVLNEHFVTCTASLPTGWQQYSVTGSDSWKCTVSGLTDNGVYMNGYSGGGNNDNEDWLISPQLNLTNYSIPHLSFHSRTKFNGNAITVMVSTNYAGSGNPNIASWTALPVSLPAMNSDEWTLSDNIDLSAYKTQPVYVAYKYTSTVNAAALWRIDNVQIFEHAVNLSKKFLNAGQCAAGSTSTPVSFQFTMTGLTGNLLLNAPSPFQISKDNISFSSQITYTAAASGIPQTVYVRINPQIVGKVWRDSLMFAYNGNPVSARVYCLGTSLPDDKTLRVCNWNMRWFGEPQMCNCDTAVAKDHARMILTDLQADVYCLQEVVSLAQLNFLTAALGPNYQSVVSTYCSGVTNVNDPYYVGCQKLAFIYNTQKLQNLGNYGLLSSTYPADTSAYYCFGSGRFPYLMKAKLLLANGIYDTLIFVDLQGKAYDAQEDYNRRACGAQKMTDSLNLLFPNKKIMVIGDFNDFLEGSTVTGNANSPYKYMLDHGFTGLTLPSKYPGKSTYVWSTDYIIDNIACTPDLFNRYADSSFFIFTEAASYITDYGHSSSDHFPCMSYYQFNFPNAINEFGKSASPLPFSLLNPSSNTLYIHTAGDHREPVLLCIYDLSGIAISRRFIDLSKGTYSLPLPYLAKGMYLVELRSGQKRGIQKWMVQ